MGRFERYLTIWVGLAILGGVGLGYVLPSLFQTIAGLEYAHVNFVVAALIWVMIYPMMVSVDFSTLGHVAQRPKGLIITLLINWLVKPFSMAALGVVFLNYVFSPFIPAADARQYVAGLILLGAAPCTAMVFVWSRLVKGDANYTLVQVSLNDLVMIAAYAPIVALLLGVTHVTVPWQTLILSVLLYVVMPIIAGYATRKALSGGALTALLDHLKPWSIIGLLATVVLLFGFQAPVLIAKPLVIAMIAVPILVQSLLMFFLTFAGMRRACVPHNVCAPAALIGASNFFELAVAVAISLFGLHSGAALATVVGVLVEVPVMLWLVGVANRKTYELPPKKASS
ncbi:ACR3 family arsenite efflux transporter [Asticcacaulis sp. EMRT-3]|uniref:ACR3 family arsenite efflux transporter n=1 Tax=Asticcacaulis sp. EMRT-3 TaxID=3040349 RepID=UPI0024AFD260|nr:ACR3 family arsenite efflux transporter [Asticcacaulis sp. EMRT-3]MDI7776384.1 ACR3 family arsenite efflux transporter [Asticcacaulis sp. EMRT-3]